MKELQTKILAVMADVSYIKKDGQNQQQGYKFASAESIIGEVLSVAAAGFDRAACRVLRLGSRGAVQSSPRGCR